MIFIDNIKKGIKKMTSNEYCKLAVAALEDRKAEDVKVIDIREVSPVADFFIIANGTNQNQIQAMRDACDEALYKAGLNTKQIEGNSNSTWILMDYGDIIVHIFSKEDRLFYDLERVWSDGKVIDVNEL
jgi:ribosome-associated protein